MARTTLNDASVSDALRADAPARNNRDSRAPAQTRPTGIRDEPLRDYAAQRFSRYVKRMRKREKHVLRTGGADPVHEMRVEIRRIRSALQMLANMPDCSPTELTRRRKALSPLARALGAVRDLDILIADIETRVADGEFADLDALHAALWRERIHSKRELDRLLKRKKTQRAIKALWRLRHPDVIGKHVPDVAVRYTGGSVIWRRYEEIARFAPVVADASLDELHALRIACKRLRYTLEFFADVLGSGADELITLLTDAQDKLGALQDRRSALTAILGLPASVREAGDTMRYATWSVSERDRLLGMVPQVWQRLADPELARRLAALTVDLETGTSSPDGARTMP